ncbi:MAG TPA: preprotein translocase subunit SecE [Longimicrobium sp.]|nr:preprotein translocase subunit SecE [Longimicrobium sp.]
MAETTRSTPADFFREVAEQVRKVTWPDWDQLKSSTGVIVVFVLAVALIIFGMDYVINHALALVTSLFTG